MESCDDANSRKYQTATHLPSNRRERTGVCVMAGPRRGHRMDGVAQRNESAHRKRALSASSSKYDSRLRGLTRVCGAMRRTKVGGSTALALATRLGPSRAWPLLRARCVVTGTAVVSIATDRPVQMGPCSAAVTQDRGDPRPASVRSTDDRGSRTGRDHTDTHTHLNKRRRTVRHATVRPLSH